MPAMTWNQRMPRLSQEAKSRSMQSGSFFSSWERGHHRLRGLFYAFVSQHGFVGGGRQKCGEFGGHYQVVEQFRRVCQKFIVSGGFQLSGFLLEEALHQGVVDDAAVDKFGAVL